MTTDTTKRHVTEPDFEGFYLEAKLTEEGVIVDTFGPDDECIDTFALTYDEFIQRGIANHLTT